MIDTPARSAVNLGPLDRIPSGEGRTFAVGDTRITVFRSRTGGLYASQAACPHKAGPLADGIVGAATVICPLHSYAFDLASGKSIGDRCESLRVYPVSLSDSGDVLLTVDVDA